MGQRDLASRGEAVPFDALPFGYNRNAYSDYDVSNSNGQGDLASLIRTFNSGLEQNPVRLLRPSFGPITQAYLTFKLDIGTDEPSPIELYIGRGLFDYTPLGSADPQYFQDEGQIMEDHRKLTGRSEPFSAGPGGTIDIKRLDLMPLIPNQGDDSFPYLEEAWFRTYGFVLMFMFNRVPSAPVDANFQITNGYHLWKFKIEAAALIRGTI